MTPQKNSRSRSDDDPGAGGSPLPVGVIERARNYPIRDLWERLGGDPLPGSTGLISSPFRQDSNPSFQIGGSRNIAFDFATQESFDTIGLVQKMLPTDSFRDAVYFILGNSSATPRTANHAGQTEYTKNGSPPARKLWNSPGEAQLGLDELPFAGDDPEVLDFLRREYGLNDAHATWRVWSDDRGRWIAYPGFSLGGDLVSVKAKSLARNQHGKRFQRFLFGGGGFLIAWGGGPDWVLTGGEEKAQAAAQLGYNALTSLVGEKGISSEEAAWLAQTARGRILIANDHDDAGRRANSLTAERLLDAGIPMERVFSADWGDRPKGFDLNNLLLDAGPDVDLFEILVPSGLHVAVTAPDGTQNASPPTGDATVSGDAVADLEDSLSEAGAAARFVALCRDRVVYDSGAGWRVWDGRRWTLDDDGGAVRAFLQAVPGWYEAEGRALLRVDPQSKRGAAFLRWGENLRSKARVDAVLALARNLGLTRPADAFDSSQWLFNCMNGTIDLKSGRLQPHRREDFLTKISPVVFDPDARDARWEQFLLEAMGGDPEMVTFLQRCAGYALTGDTSEEKVFLLLGCGGSGKSTFLEALRSSLGDYAHVSPGETFLENRNQGGATPEIAALVGVRLVAASELPEGRRLNAALLKSLSGGEAVSARRLYHDPFTFTPRCKIVIAGNDAPHVSDQDSGFWRRCLRVPFEKTPTKPDPSLKAHLKDPSPLGVGSAVFSWALRGCLAWQRSGGLGVPEAVRVATNTYRQGENPVIGFLDDVCILESGAFCRAGDLRRGYESWCVEMGFRPVGPKPFADRLRAAGCSEARTYAEGRIWRGIRLKPAP